MIEWLRRQPAERMFLDVGSRAYSYGETLEQVSSIGNDRVTVFSPRLDADSVFRCLAGLSGAGLMVHPPHVQPPDRTDLAGAALVVFTSGTTGAPKGVRLTTENLEAASRASVEHLGHDEGDRWLLNLPLYHVGGLSIVVRSVYAGGAVQLLGRFDEARVAAALRGGVTMISVVAAMLRRLLDHDPGPYPLVRAVLVGGGPIPEGLLEAAAATGLPVLPTYGMTETFGQVATLRPGSPLVHRAHVLPGVEVRIEGDGRIALRGAQVSPGYLGEPDRSDPWLVTNDLGSLHGEGALEVVGRADAVIITGGMKVDPAQIEAVLSTHPGVDEAVVFGQAHPQWGEVVACAYRGVVSEDELERWVVGRLPPHMVPRRLIRVTEFPRTPLGKPDRRALGQLMGESATGGKGDG